MAKGCVCFAPTCTVGASISHGPSKEALSFGASDRSFTGFSEEDLNTVVDLRVFMDPAPHTISELAPMASVYHMFNQVS